MFTASDNVKQTVATKASRPEVSRCPLGELPYALSGGTRLRWAVLLQR